MQGFPQSHCLAKGRPFSAGVGVCVSKGVCYKFSLVKSSYSCSEDSLREGVGEEVERLLWWSVSVEVS